MLPSQLLRVRVRRGRIIPMWALGREEELELASELISLFSSSVGGTLGELEESLEELEEVYEAAGVDYRLFRGLSTLLERRLEVERPDAPVDPAEARRVVFEECARSLGGFAVGEERRRVLEAAASRLGIPPEELEACLWADREDRLRVVSFSPLEPEELLRRYNLSLLQTALFRAVWMRVRTGAPGGPIKLLLREVKRRGLMYHAEREDGRVSIHLDGPASVLKMTTRYGTSMAKVVPRVVSLPDWELAAGVVREVRGRRTVLTLTVDDRLRDIFPEAGEEPEAYDSSAEEEVAALAAGMGWSVRREPGPLIAGRSIFLPDFELRKGPVRVYLEVVGFWTPDYLRRKVEKLSSVGEEVLVLADRELACAPLERVSGRVVYFRRRVDPAALARALSEVEERAWRSARGEARERVLASLSSAGELVDLEELARSLGLTRRQVEDVLSESPPEGYLLRGGMLISEGLASRVREAVLGASTLAEAAPRLRALGVPDDAHPAVLEAAGFRLVWRSLDPADVRLVPPEGSG
ncbi:MAG: hypothetical protein DRO06_04590 [Thermoproteota archaeon]|nr:MAG: hypothetical protein DRO06_04590 [Candidatus Korarchaeota archaeon]